MVLKEFRILFDNPLKTYRPGETIKARLLLVLGSPMHFREIRVQIEGKAYTSWNDSRSRKAPKLHSSLGRYYRVTGDEEYLSIMHNIAGGSFGGEYTLMPGRHIYPFECTLPPDLPSSFNSTFGYISYTVIGTIERPWKFDHKTIDVFKVVSNYDLNLDPKALEAVSIKKTKIYGFWNTSHLTVNLSLPFRGYVPGQMIPIKVVIDNNSNKNVNHVNLKLEMNVIYRAIYPYYSHKIESIIIDESNYHQMKNVLSFQKQFEIPSLLPSSLDSHRIIKIEYVLRFQACISGCFSSNLKMKIPILIGTVPVAHYPIGSRNDGFPFMAHFSGPRFAQNYSANNCLPPPSYEESVLGSQSIQDQAK